MRFRSIFGQTQQLQIGWTIISICDQIEVPLKMTQKGRMCCVIRICEMYFFIEILFLFFSPIRSQGLESRNIYLTSNSSQLAAY